MEFIALLNLPLDANIIDIGDGNRHFADALLDKGYKNIYLLDISANAINKAKQRLGKRASLVHWIVSDITDFEPLHNQTFGTIKQHFTFAGRKIRFTYKFQ